MAKLEKFPFVALKYEWNIPSDVERKGILFLSKKIMYKENDSFRTGLRIESSSFYEPSSTLLFLSLNLRQIGLRVMRVSYSFESDTGKIEETDLKISNEKENEAVQLFTSQLFISLPKKIRFKFTIFLAGIVDNYQVLQMDGLLSHQLCSSLEDRSGADFNLIAKNGKRFPVHGSILAARSPIFALLLSNDQEVKSKPIEPNYHSMDCTIEEMTEFIKFIYTGGLESPISNALMKLAVKYKVKTLVNLCLAGSQDLSVDAMASLAMRFKPGSKSIYDVEFTYTMS